MNHIVLGVDDTKPTGTVLGFIGIGVVVLSWVAAHYVSWYLPRGLQHLNKALTEPAKMVTLDRLIPQQRYTRDQISPHFWPNGKMPEREDWRRLAENEFKDYTLRIDGLVENPVELSLEELRALGNEETITMHHCIRRITVVQAVLSLRRLPLASWRSCGTGTAGTTVARQEPRMEATAER